MLVGLFFFHVLSSTGLGRRMFVSLFVESVSYD